MKIVHLETLTYMVLIIHGHDGYGIKADQNASTSSTKKLKWLILFSLCWILEKLEVKYDGHRLVHTCIWLNCMYSH